MENTTAEYSGSSVGQALKRCLMSMSADSTSFPKQATTSCFIINGLVRTERLAWRGQGGRDLFRVGIGSGGDWAPIEEAWDDGHLPDDELEELFIEHVILEDMIAQEAEQWGFPGDDYTIVVEPA
ncbi:MULTISPECIES: hypothetical protein [Streptomyces violaceusniger group]|uniref:Uncharacterized protein n=2 Tax=Streptomyces rhizosphaericus TaxID=114699 RepID=A0ABP3ZC08_9ACTN|nr:MULTISPECIES: hypothetical protein [Streptomyces violaceusniger group]